MDARRAGRLHGQPVDVHPALVDQLEPGIDRDVAGAVRRHHVQHVGLHLVEFEHGRTVGDIDVAQFALRAVFDDALVVVGPGLHEQTLLRHDVLVRVEHQHPGTRFEPFQVPGNGAGTLVRSGRAAVGRFRDGQRKHATVRHRLQLPAQRDSLRSGLPRVQDGLSRGRRLQTRQVVIKEIDAG